MKRLETILILAIALGILGCSTQTDMPANADQAAFEQASEESWQEVFSDSGTGDWKKQWFLDGEIGKATTGPEGMALTAGPEFKNDAHHMVLWTKESFEGDLKIESIIRVSIRKRIASRFSTFRRRVVERNRMRRT